MEAFSAGTLAGAGSFECDLCGFAIALHELDRVPSCPECGGRRFRRASLFGHAAQAAHHLVDEPPAWLEQAREGLDPGADYLAFEEDGRVRIVTLRDGWTRIGRSLSAHVHFDDPTVSRRHALIYRDESGARMLDDRSLNGVFHNGRRIELAELRDGDEIAIGRFRLYFVGLAGARVGAPHPPDPPDRVGTTVG